MENLQSPLLLSPAQSAVVTITQDARNRRDAIMSESSRRLSVGSKEDADDAVAMLKEIKTFVSFIEESKKTVKRPVIDLGKAIDDVARDLCAELTSESSRLSRVLGIWIEHQRKLEADAQAAARLEQQRIQDEKNREIRRAQMEADTPKQAAATVEKIKENAVVQLTAAALPAQAVAETRTKGIATRTNYFFEILDFEAFEKAYPNLVLKTANAKGVEGLIRTLDVPGRDSAIAGVRWWKESRSHIRGL
jgi:hypothetical protein